MAKVVDENGFWYYENNPVSKEGVFPYLGKQISPELEPEKIYMVYRPAEELSRPETVESFSRPKPFNDEHEMLGEGFTPCDSRPAQGVLSNVHYKDGTLYGDISVFSEELKNEISNGKKELSLGYLCRYDLQRGVWNGQSYDAIQRDIRGNHVALVDRGRMGSDVRVYDRSITMDKMDITTDAGFNTATDKEIPSSGGNPEKSGGNRSDNSNKGESQMAKANDELSDKREAIREVMAIAAKPNSDFEGGEEEKIETIAKLLEKSEYSKSEAGTATDGCDKTGKDEDDADSKEKDKTSEDENDTEEAKKSNDKTSEDENDTDEDKDDEAKKAMDAMPRQIMKMLAEKSELVESVKPLIGSFACDSMTAEDVAVYACKKLGIKVNDKEAKPALRGYLAAHSKEQKVYGLDSAPITSGEDKATQRYLKGE